MLRDCGELIGVLNAEFAANYHKPNRRGIDAIIAQLPDHCQSCREVLIEVLLRTAISHAISINGRCPSKEQLTLLHPEVKDEIVRSHILPDLSTAGNIAWVLGNYRIDEVLSEGAEGWVAKAFNFVGAFDAALKVYHTSTPVASLVREQVALHRLQHEYVIRLRDKGECWGRSFIALDLCNGVRLSSAFPSGSVTVDQTLTIMDKLCIALDHCHSRMVFHCDVKPENIMYGFQGDFKLIDFGLARVGHEQLDPSLEEKEVLGTYAYMSPERASGRRNCSLRMADVVGAGGTLFWLLTGRPPFDGATPEECRRHASQGYINPVAMAAAKQKHSKLAEVCLRVLSVDESHRPASIGDLSTEIRQAAVHLARVPSVVLEVEKRANASISNRDTAVLLEALESEIQVRRARLHSIEFTMRLCRDNWSNAYQHHYWQRRRVKFAQRPRAVCRQAERLIGLQRGITILRAPIDCTMLACQQSAHAFEVRLQASFNAVPKTLVNMADHPSGDLRKDFEASIAEWVSLLENNVEVQLDELRTTHRRALLRYSNNLRRHKENKSARVFWTCFNVTMWLVTSVVFLSCALVIVARLAVTLAGLGVSARLDMVSLNEQPFFRTRMIVVGILIAFLLASRGIRKGTFPEDWRHPDHPFHRRRTFSLTDCLSDVTEDVAGWSKRRIERLTNSVSGPKAEEEQ